MKYFDYAASCPLDGEAAELYVKAATEYYGNSQSLHDAGSSAANLLEGCRKEIASLVGVDSAGVYFTGGGSEANVLGIEALLSTATKKGRHIITGAAEHSSVFNFMKKLEMDGWEVTYLPFNNQGVIVLEDVVNALREETVLISIQHGNPEIGTLQPIEEISQICRSRGILLHSDCVQTFGKIPLQRIAHCVDALSISGHKFYGPKGTGAAYINPKLAWKPSIPGTVHEKGFRPGTVNVPGIAAMTAAARKASSSLDKEMTRLWYLRRLFKQSLTERMDDFHIFDLEEKSQLPGIIGMTIQGVEGQFVLLECSRKGYAISTGTACHTGMLSPAKTMTAMGISRKEAKEFFRVSFGRDTKADDVKELASILSSISIGLSSV